MLPDWGSQLGSNKGRQKYTRVGTVNFGGGGSSRLKASSISVGSRNQSTLGWVFFLRLRNSSEDALSGQEGSKAKTSNL